MSWRAILTASLVGLALGFALGAWTCRTPAPNATVQAADHVVAVQTRHAAAAETVYVHDTVQAARWFARYDTARVTDTVTVDRIVYVRRDVADSVKATCTLALRSCGATVDSLHRLQAADQVARDARDAAQPSRLHTILNDAGWAAGGYLACRAGVGAGLSLRVP